MSENVSTDWSIIKILSKVPASFLVPEDFDRVGAFLTSQFRTSMVGPEIGITLLPHVLASGDPALVAKLFSVAMAYRWESRAGTEEAVPLIDEYWLGEMLKKHFVSVSKLVPFEVASDTTSIVEQIGKRDSTAFHIVAIPSVEDLAWEDRFKRYETFLVRVVRDCLIEATDQSEERAQKVIRELISIGQPIFVRIALNVISARWGALSPVFWEVAGPHFLADALLGPEVRRLAQSNFGGFSDKQKDQWLEWIESAPYWIPEDLKDDDNKRNQYLARQKLRNLSPIKHWGYRSATELFEHHVEISGFEPAEDVMDEVSIGPVIVQHEDQRITEELLRMAVPAIVELLSKQPEERSRIDREDIQLGLQQATETNPNKFARDLQSFAGTSYRYQGALLRGLVSVWKADRSFEWRTVIEFWKDLVSKDGFWEDIAEDPTRWEIVSQIADLIREGTAKDSHAIAPEHLPAVLDVLMLLLERAPSTVQDADDLLLGVLNSPRGRVLGAVMNFSLRIARLNKDASPDQRWHPRIREEFTRRLDRKVDDTLEFSFTVGQYLPNLYYLDRKWMESSIDRIFLKAVDRHWRAAFSGYLAHPTFYREFYHLLRSRDHYAKALQTTFADRHLSERLIHHLCFAYLQGNEKLGDPDSLFESLLARWDIEVLREMIRFFWMQQKDELDPSSKQKVLGVCQRIARHYGEQTQLSIDEKTVLSNLSKLSVYLDLIDATALEWLKLSAKYVDVGHDSPTFVEQLDRLADSSPHEVGEVYIGMLDNEILPDYEISHILSCVEKLFVAGEHDQANTICNLYLSRGYEAFRELFRKYNE